MKFNVLTVDFNTGKPVFMDVIPYLVKEYKESDFSKYKDIYDFIKCKSLYMWWGKCQYEIVVNSFPENENSYKTDVYEQVMANIEIVAEILKKYIKINNI